MNLPEAQPSPGKNLMPAGGVAEHSFCSDETGAFLGAFIIAIYQAKVLPGTFAFIVFLRMPVLPNVHFFTAELAACTKIHNGKCTIPVLVSHTRKTVKPLILALCLFMCGAAAHAQAPVDAALKRQVDRFLNEWHDDGPNEVGGKVTKLIKDVEAKAPGQASGQ